MGQGGTALVTAMGAAVHHPNFPKAMVFEGMARVAPSPLVWWYMALCGALAESSSKG